MKKIFYLVLLTIVSTMNLFSQDILQCGVDERLGIIDESIYSHDAQRNINTSNQYAFNVFFHVIRDDSGNNVTGVTENEILDAVAMLNITYNQFDIFFKYRGFDYIDNSDYLTTDYIYGNSNDEYHSIQNRPEMKADAFNLCIVDEMTWTNSSGQAYNVAGIAMRPGTFSVFDKDYLLTATLPHEIGHNFNLLHTHQGYNSSNCEHVSGDNCAVAGDYVCDTPASYRFTTQDLDANNNYQNNSGTTDCVGDLYINVPIHNFMSNNLLVINNFYHNLRTEFTAGQGVRMRESISNTNSNIYQAKMTSIESLYEPYYAEIEVDYDWVTSETTTHGSVTTCYGSKWVHKFQKGFDYDFYHWNGGDATNSDYLYSKQIHEQPIDEAALRAVKINQVSTTVIKVYESTAGVRPGADSNCTTARVTGGKIISSDVNGNDIDVKDLNANEITDPNLIQTLENNKIHHIKKDLDNGKEIDKVIYKTDN